MGDVMEVICDAVMRRTDLSPTAAYEVAEEVLAALPEIIHCKYCKHRHLFLGRNVCQYVCFEATDEMYCSKAERRNDG